MGHYMTKEGVSIICKNCLYWGRVKYGNGVMGTCGNAKMLIRNKEMYSILIAVSISGQIMNIGSDRVVRLGGD